ncbi:flagellin [Desulfosporosinus sp.]|uniref:flagellin N-terminal helical domain-containing protein n=1 Tax=Desulfosporosinus sp. TaxID=157907 RepID=UPI0025C55F29|nr:flagellin [Desulfosporosinus sp.]MBC2723827.1 flagellin protein [Desulfosporosinus sp.]MBC2728846.1 flagellin protein [Desulfosporosinus sp.]
MIINHNMASLNTYRQLSTNNVNSSKSLEKLSSGLRINKAGDDAAGLAISEKMRGQIRGLDQATRNSQDGISMIQTAEGSLSETHAILQRMKELATQSASDTNVSSDRDEIQKEINQLSSEINRIGNTTEFNTQSLLKGDGKTTLDATGITAGTGSLTGGAEAYKTQAKRQDTMSIAAATHAISYTINGQVVGVTFGATGAGGNADHTAYGVTANAATINVDASQDAAETATDVASAMQAIIDKNDTLKGNYTVTASGNDIIIKATKDGRFDGAAGNISAATPTTMTATNVPGGTAAGADIAAAKATTTLTMPTIGSAADATALVGKGITVNGTVLEFYNANDGAYTGNAQGIDISGAIEATANWQQSVVDAVVQQADVDGVTLSNSSNNIVVTAATGGVAGNNIKTADGGVQEQFKATFQVGANKGQSFTIDINDMRSEALGITAAAGTAGFKAENTVTDGTSETVKEAALDVSSHTSATAAIKVIDDAIASVSAERSKLGAFTNRLEHTINNLGTSSENLTGAESRIRDVDMAKEMMNFQKNNILSQAAQAMLAQANQQPQGVLQLLR